MKYTAPSAGQTQIRLYSPTSVWLAAFIGSIPGGTVLLAANYRKLHNVKAAHQTLLYGFLSTIVLLVVAVVIAQRFAHGVHFGVEIGVAVGMYQLAQIYQGAAFEAYLRQGGLKASHWQAAGIGLLCLLGLCTVLFAVQVLIVGPIEGIGPESFTDPRSSFTVTRPKSWYLESGEALRKRMERTKSHPFHASPNDSQTSGYEVLVRLVRYAPVTLRQNGIIVMRLDWAGFSSHTDLDALLRTLLPHESNVVPTTVELGGRPWREVRVKHAVERGGFRYPGVFELYVTAGDGWALQLTTVHPNYQPDQSQPLFDEVLRRISFKPRKSTISTAPSAAQQTVSPPPTHTTP